MKRRKPAASNADFSGCACEGLHLPKLVQPLVMAALLEGPLHGYAIVQRLAAGGAHLAAPPDHSGVYRLLRSLARRGLVTSQRRVSSAGPARNEYALTDAGRRCLAQWKDSLIRYRAAVDTVLRACDR